MVDAFAIELENIIASNSISVGVNKWWFIVWNHGNALSIRLETQRLEPWDNPHFVEIQSNAGYFFSAQKSQQFFIDYFWTL